MTELIAELEAAKEGSRVLDARVHEHNAIAPDWEKWLVGGMPFGRISDQVPHYTTSLDAALTLVPEEWRVSHAGTSADDGWHFNLIARTTNTETGRCWSNSPALALCIAALRARQAVESDA